MNNRDKLQLIKDNMKSLEDQSSKLSHDLWAKNTNYRQLIGAIILEEKMLEGTHWYLDPGFYQTQLNLSGKIEDGPKIERLEQLFLTSSDYEDIILVTGVTFHLNNESGYLSFDDPKLMPTFVQTHKLIVDGAAISKRLRELKRELSALELVCHQFNIKG